MSDLKELISFVYGRQTEAVLEGIEKLLKEYGPIQKDDHELSEKDVVLITYGDQLSSENESCLKTLRHFLDDQVSGLIQSIHILPFYPYSSDDGFSVIDYYAVNPNLGSWEDIEELGKDFRIMFDGVINHTSQESTWFKKFLRQEPDFKDYYLEVESLLPYQNVVRPRTSPLTHEFVGKHGPKNVWTTFSQDQVDLNYREPKVFLQILDLLLFYISKGAKLIRLDAIGFMWKEPHTTCIHLDQTHAIIKAFRKVVEEKAPSTLLITETNVPHQENISYFGEGDEAHMVYNFTLPPLLAFCILKGDVTRFVEWASSLALPDPRVCFLNFLASHDGIGVRAIDGILSDEELSVLLRAAEANQGKISYRSTADGKESPYEINCNYYSLLKGSERSEHFGLQRMILAHAILLTMPGVPAIYFHSLIGSENYLAGIEQGGSNRSINREKLNYKDLQSLLENAQTRQHQILATIKQMIGIRIEHPVFHPFGSFEFDRIGSQILIIRRKSSSGDESLTAYFNLSSNPQEILIDREASSLMSGETLNGNHQIAPYQFLWLKT